MQILKPVTSLTLAFGLGIEQVTGHGKDHIPEEGGAPEPQQVRPAIMTTVTTTTPAPDSRSYSWVWTNNGWEAH